MILIIVCFGKIALAPEAQAHEDTYLINEKVDKKWLDSFITKKAIEYGVNPKLAICIARKESLNYKKEVILGQEDGDGHLICNYKWSEHYGEPIRSVGMWQWNTCAHPNIPILDAQDPLEATELAMPALRDNPWIWSTYKDCK